MKRRTLLRGAMLGTGAAFLAPLMNRLRADTGGSCRFVFVVEGNGYEPVTVLSPSVRSALDATMDSPIGTKRWWYRDYRHDTPIVMETPDLGSARSLGGLGREGLIDQSTVLLGLSSKVAGGGHSASHGALSSSRTVGGAPGGPTIDAYLAGLPALRGDLPFEAVRLGVGTGRALDFGTCALAAGRAAPMTLYPQTAYEVLFGAVATAEAREAFMRRGNLLDFARADVAAAQAEFRGSSLEREKLEAYLSSIEQLQARHGRLLEMEDVVRATAPEAPDINPLYSGEALDTLAAQMEIATAALIGGLTNVAVVGSGTGGDFGLTYSSVSSTGRHDMQHGSGGSATLLEACHTVTEREVDLVARMARTLADTPDESGGSMLDHTLIVYIGDNGEQHHSTASEFPVLLIGGRALGLRPGGRTIVYPGLNNPGNRQLSNLWNTVGHLAGQDLNNFGTEGPARIASGPLSELLG